MMRRSEHCDGPDNHPISSLVVMESIGESMKSDEKDGEEKMNSMFRRDQGYQDVRDPKFGNHGRLKEMAWLVTDYSKRARVVNLSEMEGNGLLPSEDNEVCVGGHFEDDSKPCDDFHHEEDKCSVGDYTFDAAHASACKRLNNHSPESFLAGPIQCQRKAFCSTAYHLSSTSPLQCGFEVEESGATSPSTMDRLSPSPSSSSHVARDASDHATMTNMVKNNTVGGSMDSPYLHNQQDTTDTSRSANVYDNTPDRDEIPKVDIHDEEAGVVTTNKQGTRENTTEDHCSVNDGKSANKCSSILAEACKLPDSKHPAACQKTPFNLNRYIILASYCIYSFVTAACYMNWPPLATMLFKSGAFEWTCERHLNPYYESEETSTLNSSNLPFQIDNSSPIIPGYQPKYIYTPDLRQPPHNKQYICDDQDTAVQSLFTLTIACHFTMSAFAGNLLDTIGPKFTAMIGQSMTMIGWVLLAVSSATFKSIIPGFVFMGLGADTGFLPTLPVANLFPGSSALIITVIGAAASGSFAVPVILKEVWKSSSKGGSGVNIQGVPVSNKGCEGDEVCMNIRDISASFGTLDEDGRICDINGVCGNGICTGGPSSSTIMGNGPGGSNLFRGIICNSGTNFHDICMWYFGFGPLLCFWLAILLFPRRSFLDENQFSDIQKGEVVINERVEQPEEECNKNKIVGPNTCVSCFTGTVESDGNRVIVDGVLHDPSGNNQVDNMSRVYSDTGLEEISPENDQKVEDYNNETSWNLRSGNENHKVSVHGSLDLGDNDAHEDGDHIKQTHHAPSLTHRKYSYLNNFVKQNNENRSLQLPIKTSRTSPPLQCVESGEASGENFCPPNLEKTSDGSRTSSVVKVPISDDSHPRVHHHISPEMSLKSSNRKMSLASRLEEKMRSLIKNIREFFLAGAVVINDDRRLEWKIKKENKEETPLIQQYLSEYFLLICFYFVGVNWAVGFYQQAPRRMFSSASVVDVMGVMTPLSFIPCIILGKFIDILGIIAVLFIVNTFGVLMYLFSFFGGGSGKSSVVNADAPIAETIDDYQLSYDVCGYISVVAFTVYMSLFTSQVFCYIERTFSFRHFGKMVGLVSMVGGLLSLLVNPLYKSLVVEQYAGDPIVAQGLMIGLLTLMYLVVLRMWFLRKKNPRPFSRAQGLHIGSGKDDIGHDNICNIDDDATARENVDG